MKLRPSSFSLEVQDFEKLKNKRIRIRFPGVKYRDAICISVVQPNGISEKRILTRDFCVARNFSHRNISLEKDAMARKDETYVRVRLMEKRYHMPKTNEEHHENFVLSSFHTRFPIGVLSFLFWP